MGEVNAKAAADPLDDVRIKGGELTITPLKAITPEAAEDAADRLYAMAPNVRITSVLADVHRWTGFADAFTHLHTGLPADDPRVVLTAVLADATNLGLTRMADACAVASYRRGIVTLTGSGRPVAKSMRVGGIQATLRAHVSCCHTLNARAQAPR